MRAQEATGSEYELRTNMHRTDEQGTHRCGTRRIVECVLQLILLRVYNGLYQKYQMIIRFDMPAPFNILSVCSVVRTYFC